MIADAIGDWREEIVVSPLQDPLYRNDVALQTIGYFCRSQPSSRSAKNREGSLRFFFAAAIG